MEETISMIVDILMIGLILLQFVVLISILRGNHARRKLEKQFWKEQSEEMHKVYDKLTEQIVFIENTKEALEDAGNEQTEGDTIPEERVKSEQ